MGCCLQPSSRGSQVSFKVIGNILAPPREGLDVATWDPWTEIRVPVSSDEGREHRCMLLFAWYAVVQLLQ
jgi:hypothetical protein